jgi:hypothetical protein
MPDVPFPMLTMPGQQPNVAGGRLINCYPEPLSQTAGKPNAYWRVPGLNVWGTAPSGIYRGGVYVQSQGIFYAIFGTTVYSYGGPGAGTALGGAVAGTKFCWCTVNQAVTPDVVFVSPGIGAFWVAAGGTTVGAYPDSNVGTPDAVTFMDGFFIFTDAAGQTIVSDLNTTTINPLNFATAQSKPDPLWRPVPLGNGQLLLCGANTMEVWGSPINPTGYPFSYVSTIYRGIPGPSAIAGDEDAWGKGIYFVGDDNRVSTLSGYTVTPVSIPDLDQKIENEIDKTKIIVGVYVARGHGMVVVQSPTWCWEFDTTINSWHERQSYLQLYWRGFQPKNVFSTWICGDVEGSNLLKIDPLERHEVGDPLRMRIETGPIGAFPQRVRINGIEIYMTKGASNALGIDPQETNAGIEVSVSRDSGETWSIPRTLYIGRQAMTSSRCRGAIWGLANVEGVRWRFDESAGINFAFMGADMQVDVLR